MPVLTGDPMSTSASLVEASGDRQVLERLSDDELLHRAAREVVQAACVIARALATEPRLAVTMPGEFGCLAHALALCVQEATAAFAIARRRTRLAWRG